MQELRGGFNYHGNAYQPSMVVENRGGERENAFSSPIPTLVQVLPLPTYPRTGNKASQVRLRQWACYKSVLIGGYTS